MLLGRGLTMSAPYRIIEPYTDDDIVIDGRTSPTLALVEDGDAMRLLFTDAPSIPARVWVRAHTAGARAIVMPPGESDPDQFWYWTMATTFMAERTEHHPTASFTLDDERFWVETNEAWPQYRSMVATPVKLEEPAPTTGSFVNIHNHSEFSALDGLSRVHEIVREAVADNQPAVAVADHGTCAGHPHLQIECDKHGIKPIFAIEAHFVDDRFVRPAKDKPKQSDFRIEVAGGKPIWSEEMGQYAPAPATWKDDNEAYKAAVAAHEAENSRIKNGYNHLLLWAVDNEGLRNLWAMSTEANRDGFYYRPRMDWNTLEKYGKGVGCSTACLRGLIAQPLLNGDEDLARQNLARLLSIFDDRLYMEVGTNQLPDQIRANRMIVDMAEQHGIPLLAAVDSHYPCFADKEVHRTWIAMQTNSDVQDEADLFAGDSDYHMLDAKDVRGSLSYLGDKAVAEAMKNTVEIAARCTARVEGKVTTPIFTKGVGLSQEERIARDRDRAVDICIANWSKVQGKGIPDEVYMDRFEEEAALLTSKNFWGYFLMVYDQTDFAKNRANPRILVGPGRGSGGGCLIAYLLNIVEIDPVEADLLFARFLTEGRTSLPDFDVDYPSSMQDTMSAYNKERWGDENVVRVGTHLRLKNKGVVRDLARTLKTTIEIDYRDIDAISKLIEEAEADSAGLGMKWEELWDQHKEALEPYAKKYPLLFERAGQTVGRLKSYGKHAAGWVISPDEPLTGRLPLRASGDMLVAEFDMDALEALGLVKFDLLNLRTLDTIQMCVDMIREHTGDDINVYAWRDEYQDPQIWESISDGHTLGIFQIETRAGTKLTKQFRPQNMHELADVITLVRPGPVRSGLTATYFRRRAGEEPVSFPDERMAKVLAPTLGCILYQEQVMAACMLLAGYSENEADAVRKILGKKKVEAVAEAGIKFVREATARGMAEGAAQHLWDQMAEFARYSFNKAHAYGYAVLGYWTAWLKFHYPAFFLTAALSTVDQKRIPEFVNEARRMGYKVLPPDVNESGESFNVVGLSVRYGLNGIKGIGEKALAAILAGQPYESYEDFIAKTKGTPCNIGTVKLLAAVGALDSIIPDGNRRRLETELEWVASGESARCTFKNDNHLGPNGLPCTFDWSSEPVEIGKSGKPKKPKALPKRCTKACRNYNAPTLDVDVPPYTDEVIRAKEMELLGIHLSSTPFDHIPAEVMEDLAVAEDVESGPPGKYNVAAIITKARPYRDRNGREMGFLGLMAQTGELDVVCFGDEWSKYRQDLKQTTLVLATVNKNERGLQLTAVFPL